jgi:type IX secretion system substrate protein
MRRFIQISFLILILMFQIVVGQTIPKSLYIVNSLGENLSFVNLENHGVNSNAATLGLYTNQIKIRRDKGYVVNSGLNELQIINLQTFSTMNQIPLGTGTNPYNMDFINDSLCAVSLLFTNQVAIVNVNSGQVVQNINVGNGPEGLKYYNGKIYVTNTNFNGAGYDPGTVSVIDVSSLTVENTISVGTNPQSADIDSNGNLIVSCTGDYASVYSQVDVVNLTSGSVTNSIPLNTFITSVFVNSNNKVYITTFGFGVMVYDLTSQTFERDEADPLPGGSGCVFDNQNNCYIVDFNEDSIRAFSENHVHLNSYLVGDGPVSVDVFDESVNIVSEENFIVPEKMVLFQNYPNPFNPETQIGFYLPNKSDIQLTVYNMLGQEIFSILKNNIHAGYNTIKFDGSNFSSGAYIYKFKTGNNIRMKRMILIK